MYARGTGVLKMRSQPPVQFTYSVTCDDGTHPRDAQLVRGMVLPRCVGSVRIHVCSFGVCLGHLGLIGPTCCSISSAIMSETPERLMSDEMAMAMVSGRWVEAFHCSNCAAVSTACVMKRGHLTRMVMTTQDAWISYRQTPSRLLLRHVSHLLEPDSRHTSVERSAEV